MSSSDQSKQNQTGSTKSFEQRLKDLRLLDRMIQMLDSMENASIEINEAIRQCEQQIAEQNQLVYGNSEAKITLPPLLPRYKNIPSRTLFTQETEMIENHSIRNPGYESTDSTRVHATPRKSNWKMQNIAFSAFTQNEKMQEDEETTGSSDGDSISSKEN